MKWFLDLDGCIVDFVGGVMKHYDLKCSYNDIKMWDSLYDYWSGTQAEFWEGIPESFWENLDFTPEGKKILDLVAPFKPTILTAPPRTGASGKQKWIQKNLPEYFDHGRYLIGPAKEAVAGPGRVLIDDADHNIRSWVKAGGIGILVPRAWNSNRKQHTLDWIICAVEYMEGLN